MACFLYPGEGASGGTLALLLGIVLTGCGGSSSSSSSDPGPGDGIGDGDTIPELDGLDTDAGADYRLYFTSTVDDQEGLYSVEPQGSATPEVELVDDEASFPGGQPSYGSYELLPIHSGTWQSGENEVSGLEMDRVFYPHFDVAAVSLWAVGTERSPASPDPEQVSSEDGQGPLGGRRFVQFDINEPDNTEMVYSDGDDDQWWKLEMGDDETTAPREFPENLHVVAVIPDRGKPGPGGYLVIDRADNDTLKKVDNDLQVVGPPLDNESNQVDGLEFVDPMGSSSQEWGVPVALQFDGEGTADLWIYKRPGTGGGAGTIEPALNGNDEPLTFTIVGGTVFDFPEESQLTYSEDAAFFSRIESDDATPYIVRLDGEGWSVLDSVSDQALDVSFVIGAGGHVVWNWDASGEKVRSVNKETGEATILDDNEFNHDISTRVFGSRDGWVFYTRDVSTVDVQTDIAVAANVHTEQRIELHDARWVGASTTGTAGLGLLSGELELSEVFMVRDDQSLAAVAAEDPEEGLVPLGDLPNPADDAEMFGVGPGPHRLLRAVAPDGAGNMYKVIYVNTREENSLFSVGSEFDGGMEAEAGYRPVSGF